MGYTLTPSTFGYSAMSPKNRVWDFFELSNETHPATHRHSPQPRRKIRPTATKPASGIPCWPSRDPIGEMAFCLLYTQGRGRAGTVSYSKKSLEPDYLFARNEPVAHFDLHGLEWIKVPVYKRQMGLLVGNPSMPHQFLEYYGESAGFAPSMEEEDRLFTGIIAVPDYWGGNAKDGWSPGAKRVRVLWIDDCCIDPEKLKKNLQEDLRIMNGSKALTYIPYVYDCMSFTDTAVSTAITKSKKDNAPWICVLFSNYAWYTVLE